MIEVHDISVEIAFIGFTSIHDMIVSCYSIKSDATVGRQTFIVQVLRDFV